VLPGRSACVRCLFEEAPPPEETPSCNEAGVLGPAVALAGALQAAEALRLLRGEPPLHADALLSFDLATGRTRQVPVTRRAGCLTCGGLTTLAAGRSLHP
jgi:molybdopterin-synthase adenylyltransferase